MDGIVDSVVNAIASALGVEGASLLATFVTISIVARLVGKLIPDDRKGFLGFVRDACKVAGLYVSNRIQSGVSVGDVSKVLAESKLPVRDVGGKFTTANIIDVVRSK